MTSLVERLRADGHKHSKRLPFGVPKSYDMFIAERREAADVIEALCEALRALIPNNICNNPNVPSDCNFPCDITMGELRQAWVALAKAQS